MGNVEVGLWGPALRSAQAPHLPISQALAGTTGRVDIWRANMAAFEPFLSALTPLLSDDERRRVLRFHSQRDQVRFVVARANLRRLLGRMTGIEPQALEIVPGRHGKPYLASLSTRLHFNLSHSGDIVLFALSADCRILGIDVEEVHPFTDFDRMASSVLTARERSEYELLDVADQQQAFFHAWTCKEALAKASGEGLGLGFDYFEVGVSPRSAAHIHAVGGDPTAAASWRLLALQPRPGYVGALAVRAPAITVRMFDLLPEMTSQTAAGPVLETTLANE